MAGVLNWGVLREARITQEEFGSLLRVTRVTVNQWVRGVSAPGLKRKRAVERLLAAVEQGLADARFPLPPGEDRDVRMKRVLVSYLRSA